MIPTSKECRAALLAVFKTNESLSDDPYGKRVRMDTLANLALERMNVTPQEYNKALEKIKSHIRASDKADGPFEVTRGAGGGVSLKKGTRL